MDENAWLAERFEEHKAARYPPALERGLPEVEHVTGKLVQQRIERDHHQLKGRTRPMRGFQTDRGARIVAPGERTVTQVAQRSGLLEDSLHV
jgi:transposase, IS6 family